MKNNKESFILAINEFLEVVQNIDDDFFTYRDAYERMYNAYNKFHDEKSKYHDFLWAKEGEEFVKENPNCLDCGKIRIPGKWDHMLCNERSGKEKWQKERENKMQGNKNELIEHKCFYNGLFGDFFCDDNDKKEDVIRCLKNHIKYISSMVIDISHMGYEDREEIYKIIEELKEGK